MGKQTIYRTKFHNLEDLDRRSIQHCMQCGNCINDVRAAVGVFGGCPMADHTPALEPMVPRGRMMVIRGLLEGELEPTQELVNDVFKCTTCNNCNEICHNGWHEMVSFSADRYNDHANVWEALRADLIEQGFEHLPGHEMVLKSLKDYDNPWQQPRRARANWARKLNIKELSNDQEQAEVLYFVGCTGALDANLRKVSIATAKILQAAKVDFGILGQDELCCGSIGIRLGERDYFKKIAKQNVERLNNLYEKSGVKTIVTSCSGCFKTFFQDYPEYADEIGSIKPEILHTTQYIKRLVDEGKIKFNEMNANVTYHDPCHLARHVHLFETPRELIKAVPGINFVEMNRNRNLSRCCGAGGGVKSGFGDLAAKISQDRLEEAEATGSEYLITTCPFCEQNFNDGVTARGSSLKIVDLLELLSEVCQDTGK